MASIKKDKKTKKWYCRVSYKDSDGKYKTKTRKGFDTKKEAEYVANELEMKVAEGIDFDQSLHEPSFAEYFEEWCNTYRIGVGLSTNTEKKYQYIIKLLHQLLKKKPLSKVTRKDYQQFINFRGKDASYNTVKRTHSYIQTAMTDALHDGLIDKDPTHNAVIYYENKPNNERNHWNEQEFDKLVKSLKSEITLNNCMLIIQALTGLRIGEVYGLSWKDVDFENKTLSVKRGYDYLHEYDFTPGKNQSSIRKISISQDLINYLREYKLKFAKYQPEYLFLNPLHRPEISCNGINKHLKKMCRECGIKELTSHSLRHTHCSILLFNGVDIHYISKRLGHSNITETLKTYSHLLDEMKDKENEKAIEVIENLGVQN